MITEEQFYITNKVLIGIEQYPESYEFLMDAIKDDSTQRIPDLEFINESLKMNENLLLMLDILDKRYEFIINAVFHYRDLIHENTLNLIDDFISKEYAQRDIVELFDYYNSIKIATKLL